MTTFFGCQVMSSDVRSYETAGPPLVAWVSVSRVRERQSHLRRCHVSQRLRGEPAYVDLVERLNDRPAVGINGVRRHGRAQGFRDGGGAAGAGAAADRRRPAPERPRGAEALFRA